MQKHHVGENKETPKLKNTTNQNTSCAALENLIKSKSTFKSVNFGVCIQNVCQHYRCRRLVRDVQHFQNPCESWCHVWCTEFCGKCPPSSRVFPIWLSTSASTESNRTQIFGWVCLHFCFCFSRDRSHFLLFFKHLEKRRKPIKQEADA